MRVSNFARCTLKKLLMLRTLASAVNRRCDQRVVSRHVGKLDREDEVRPGRDAVALAHRILGHGARLEGGERFGRLAVERDFDDGGEAVARARCGDRIATRRSTIAGVDESLHAAQAGRRRDVHLRCERLVGQGGVGLQQLQDSQIDGVEVRY